MAGKFDDLDLEIIHQLQKDGRISVTELATKVKSTRPTVTNRLKRLIDEKLIVVRTGVNSKEFGLKMASVGLEVKNEATRKELEVSLKNCPRVLVLFRTPRKANIHAIVWGENYQAMNSTLESIRDLENVDIIYTHYLGTPIQGNININFIPGNNDEPPCGMKCADCYRYENAWCLGCPASKYYKNPFLK